MGNPWTYLGNSWHIWNIFGITFEPETLETYFWTYFCITFKLETLEIKGSKNANFSLESKNTASDNIGARDRMMTSYN